MTDRKTARREAALQRARGARRRTILRQAGWATGLSLAVLGLVFVGRGAEPAPSARSSAAGRVTGAGRSDASHVLHAADVRTPRAHEAYEIAARIPDTLNRLYCWCGCDVGAAQHRSNLACFEDEHGQFCETCIGTAEIAWQMVRRGITDPARIQQAVDIRYGRGA